MLKWLFRRKYPSQASARASAEGTSAESEFRRGSVLAQSGCLEEGIAVLERVTQLKPAYPEAHYNLGSAYRDRGDNERSLAAYRRVAELVPGYADVHVDIGMLLHERGELDAAAASLERAISIRPDLAEACFQLGHVLTARGEWKEAVVQFRRASQLQPAFAQAKWAGAMAQLPAIEDADTDIEQRRQAFARELDRLEQWFADADPREAFRAVGVHQPFYLAYQEISNRELLERYGNLCARLMRGWQEHAGLAAPERKGGGRVKVGVVSAHIANHSVWNALVRGWITRLDRARFEIHLFHLGALYDQETRSAQAQATRYVGGHRSFEDWARLIHASGMEVLLYPEIGMDPTTAKLASLRLAPVQAASWGHPETSGLPTIDYFLSAAELEPPGAQASYSEALELLPGLGCWLPRERAPAMLAPAVLHELADGPLLVCPGTPFKYAARHDRLVTGIAKRVPGCKLVFFRNRPEHLSLRLERRLRDAFQRDGVDFERHVRFVPWQGIAQFRGLLAQADLYLDTVGFSGFNTALEAMKCGLPVVAREGAFMRGRLASAILKRVRMDELVAASDDTYVELAAALARDTDRCEDLHERIVAGRERLYEDSTPVEGLQKFLERMRG